MKRILYSIVLIMINFTLWPADSNDIPRKIHGIIDQQEKAWNESNIDGFMAGYWKSDQLTFQSGNKRLQGWEQLAAMYKKNYAGEKMGQLDFSDIEIKVLSKNIVCVLGRWKVTTKDSSKEGLFTLIFKRFGENWKIIHDHSS